MKIAITGASGFVGNKLIQYYKDAIAIPSLKNKTDDEIKRTIEECKADIIIHTAAMADIASCQQDPDGSYRANVVLPVQIAKSFKGKKLICFSSDQVYTGSKEIGPYTEDMVAPGNLYAEEKLEMEQRVLDINPDAVMLRAEWMYDYESYKANYFLYILSATDSLRFSSENYRGITYVKEVAEAMPAVFNLPGGAYNFGSETEKSMYEITKEFVGLMKKDLQVNDCSSKHNLWMDCSKARQHGVIFSEVSEGLQKCYNDYSAR